MKTIFVSILFFSFLIQGDSLFNHEFIGMHKTDIVKLISEKHKSFKLNSAYVNNAYNYLKYEDRIREITLLFFLNDDDNCRMVRMMSDYSNINDVKEDLDSNLKKMDAKHWQLKTASANYNVEMEEQDWFFTVSIKENTD